MKIFHYLQPLNEINYMERLSRFHGELLERKVITIMAGNKLAVRFACFPTDMLYYRKVSVKQRCGSQNSPQGPSLFGGGVVEFRVHHSKRATKLLPRKSSVYLQR